MNERYPYYLAGEARFDGSPLVVTDKFTGAPAASVAQADMHTVQSAIAAADGAVSSMRALPAFRRQAILTHVATRLSERLEECAQLMCIEAGKPINDARGEVVRAIDTFTIAAHESLRDLGEVLSLEISSRAAGYEGFTKRVPMGPCSFITPFNFPLNLVAHKVAPAIAMGCPFVLKPAPTTPISAIMLAEILAETDLPKGAFSVLPCEVHNARPLIEDERIKLLSFTGSAAVGWKLKSQAGKKKVVLELGGNAACIIDRDVINLDAIAQRIVYGAFYQSGQSCISVQRVFVHEDLYDTMKALLVQKALQLKCGNPRDESTFLGPLITEADAQRIHEWVHEAVLDGAMILCGGMRPADQPQRFYSATILEHVSPNAKLSCEEAFGPVMTLAPFSSFESACHSVNQSRYGLQAGVFTENLRNAAHACETLEVGCVIISDIPSMRIDNMPYGGVKDSGLGREGVRYAMQEMSELKLLLHKRS